MFCGSKYAAHICCMISAHANTNTQLGTSKTDANEQAATGQETGRQLRERLRVKERAFQTMWKRTFDYSFRANEICTEEEVAVMEMKYAGKGGNKKENLMRAEPTAVRNKAGKTPASNVEPVVPAKEQSDILQPKGKSKTRVVILVVALLTPTLASISNTFLVSHALSNSASTAALITGVASTTSLLFLWAGVRGVGAWFVVAATLGFEAFCNACSVFKSVMGTMAYSLTTVSGKPSDFLDMVANFTGKDHQDVGTGIAIFTALMICGAQVSAIYELKK